MHRRALSLIPTFMLFASLLCLPEAGAVFTEVTEEALGFPLTAIGGARGISWPDYNNDGWPDIHISRDVLFVNNTDGVLVQREHDTGLLLIT